MTSADGVAELERRLTEVEDRLEIIELIARYGPAADSGSATGIAEIWAEDGEYTFGAGGDSAVTLTGEQVPALVELDSHRSYMAQGCAHVLTTPTVRIEGERAIAHNHSLVIVHEGGRWVVDRSSANRWELEKTDGRWRVRERRNALLDGTPEAFSLFQA